MTPRTVALAASLLALVVVAASPGCAAPPTTDAAVATLARSVAVPLAEAIGAATAARPGEAVAARLDAAGADGTGAAAIVVRVLFADTAGATRSADVTVDPRSGRAIYIRNERPADAAPLSDDLRATLSAPHASLAEIVSHAVARTPGRAVSAALGEPGAGRATIRIVVGGNVATVEVAADGDR